LESSLRFFAPGLASARTRREKPVPHARSAPAKPQPASAKGLFPVKKRASAQANVDVNAAVDGWPVLAVGARRRYNPSNKLDAMKKIGIHEIARVAGVSIGTVDRALHRRKGISKETRKRILQIVRNLGYKPNLAARMLSVGRAPLRIGVCIPREIHFFYDQVRDGILSEARRFESLGVSVIYRPVPRLGAGEVERVREMLDSDIRALIISPGDPHRLAPLIDEAERKDIRVLCVSSDAPGSARSTVICVDPELNGKCAAELMAKFLPSNSRVAIVTGMLQTEDHRQKTKGFSEVFPQFCKGGEVIDVIENHEDVDEAFQKCFSLLKRVRAIDGLYVSTVNCLPVCHALGAAGLSGKVRLITTDLFREMVPYFEKGTISASIYQRPYVQGQTAVRLVVDHIVAARPIPATYYLNPQIVLLSNLRLFREVRPWEASEGLAAPPRVPGLLPGHVHTEVKAPVGSSSKNFRLDKGHKQA